MLVVVVLLPLSLSMYDGEFNHGCVGGGGGSLTAAVVAAVAVVEDNYRQKRLATRASTVACRHAMTKSDGIQQRNNQPTNGSGGGGSVTAQGRQQLGSGTAATAARQQCTA